MEKENVDKKYIIYSYFKGTFEQSHHGTCGCQKL